MFREGEVPPVLDPEYAEKNYSLVVPLLSDRAAYLAGISDHGVPGLESRIRHNGIFFRDENHERIINLIKTSGVNYLLIPQEYEKKFLFSPPGFKKEFRNEAFTLWKTTF